MDAALEKAVGDWWGDRAIARIGVERLRRIWDEGIASGDPQPLDVEDVLKRAFARAEVLREARRLAS